MIHITKGIVFHQIKYSETSIIARIYTEQFGLQSYIVRGVRKQKSRMKAGYFQPLSLLEMNVYHKEKSNLQNIKEVRSAYHFNTIPFDIVKSTIALFLSEILLKSIREEVQNPALFGFIYKMVVYLDSMQEGYEDFHLYFLVHLSRFLGFFPQGKYSTEQRIFDLQEGQFTTVIPSHKLYLSGEMSRLINILKESSPFAQEKLHLNGSMRRSFLDLLIDYYRIHLEGLQDIQSHHVLKEVFE